MNITKIELGVKLVAGVCSIAVGIISVVKAGSELAAMSKLPDDIIDGEAVEVEEEES